MILTPLLLKRLFNFKGFEPGMDFSKLPIFDALSRRMNWLGQRQEVLAENIANADTPGYQPRDLSEAPFRRALAREVQPVEMVATGPGHIAGRPVRDNAFAKDDMKPYEAAPTGNAVILEQQLVKVAETQMDFQMISNLYRKHMEMFRVALGRRGS